MARKYDARTRKGGESTERTETAPVNLGSLINAWRGAQKLSLVQCAEAIGIDKAALSRLERGLPISHTNFVIVLRWAIGKVSVAE